MKHSRTKLACCKLYHRLSVVAWSFCAACVQGSVKLLSNLFSLAAGYVAPNLHAQTANRQQTDRPGVPVLTQALMLKCS